MHTGSKNPAEWYGSHMSEPTAYHKVHDQPLNTNKAGKIQIIIIFKVVALVS